MSTGVSTDEELTVGKILEIESNSSRVLLVEFGQIGDMVTRQTGVVLKNLRLEAMHSRISADMYYVSDQGNTAQRVPPRCDEADVFAVDRIVARIRTTEPRLLALCTSNAESAWTRFDAGWSR